ncbi:MAG: hypothetical protein A2487_02530 [Candidatus Raymondbacteria bacterium RifOxyC12_full_50_8]|uniref:Uncharacterized protein n=1 Tax=Candidatus Raymondbacteria bacterium RIFOXYD12_FULL_49_13 TaxID=1817890 RepID=A0A1F7FIJ0_UNCRA|nr:MAG: hypothetical protein A2248_21070 [Candidatus Raymondbacteria bacterium RIFOXYA2_FULL_49_16]OGJ95713.1 MAG: hypothetical protein A2350_12300 [Candidatus Raymondbacteria bacterium RifOxyB12_full_50_8]OGK06282.1 MAG: hypothetical protein A2519_08385 [Candidatus Raymondbacteria bacterium RIFOXYD12_FULL_49_13]OGK07737.1 MAG: hypothetical protein A2487_02530 [Candidatus Raymondbacteria bacterium RifOxyC12_full_50_8]OGP40614.1 MAG: hypothetical protein A2324_03140 [Candidatus Raymondbacteria b
MSIHYQSLDTAVRGFMIRELEHDIAGTLYASPRLTETGIQTWPQILREAFEQHDDNWIASTLRSRSLMRTEEQRRKPKGGFTVAKVPYTAPDTLAEGEFNRFYARGLCADVIAAGGTEVEVYRGKEVQNPRPESQAMIGKRLQAQKLLDDLRTSPGMETALGLPPGPNSGLTVRRV